MRHDKVKEKSCSRFKLAYLDPGVGIVSHIALKSS
jgi:hypothetical protein